MLARLALSATHLCDRRARLVPRPEENSRLLPEVTVQNYLATRNSHPRRLWTERTPHLDRAHWQTETIFSKHSNRRDCIVYSQQMPASLFEASTCLWTDHITVSSRFRIIMCLCIFVYSLLLLLLSSQVYMDNWAKRPCTGMHFCVYMYVTRGFCSCSCTGSGYVPATFARGQHVTAFI